MVCETNRIVIPIGNGMRLVAEQNPDQGYSREIFIGIEDNRSGVHVWHQDIAVVRNAYHIANDLSVEWEDDKFEVLVYADKDSEDYTDKFSIDLYKE